MSSANRATVGSSYFLSIVARSGQHLTPVVLTSRFEMALAHRLTVPIRNTKRGALARIPYIPEDRVGLLSPFEISHPLSKAVFVQGRPPSGDLSPSTHRDPLKLYRVALRVGALWTLEPEPVSAWHQHLTASILAPFAHPDRPNPRPARWPYRQITRLRSRLLDSPPVRDQPHSIDAKAPPQKEPPSASFWPPRPDSPVLAHSDVLFRFPTLARETCQQAAATIRPSVACVAFAAAAYSIAPAAR